eukprot:14292_1
MSIEVHQIVDDDIIDAVDEIPKIDDINISFDDNKNRSRNKKHIDISESSPSPSPSHESSSSSSLILQITRTRESHPLSASYKEWIINWWSISIPAIGFLGCQLSLALQNGFVTPELEELGIPEKLVNYCWLAPPLTGTIVQPLIGITSDMMDTSIP